MNCSATLWIGSELVLSALGGIVLSTPGSLKGRQVFMFVAWLRKFHRRKSLITKQFQGAERSGGVNWKLKHPV